MDLEIISDSKENPSKSPPENGLNPLETGKIPVTRFNRRRILMIASIVSGIIGITFVHALAPHKKLSAQEIAEETSKNATTDWKPNLPENMAAAPARYGDLRPQSAKPGGPTTLGKNPGQDSPEGGDSGSKTADDPSAGQRKNLTPAQQVAQARTDQRQKDSISATRAPVSFGGGSGTGFNDAAPAKETRPNLPDMSSVNKVIDRLSAGPGPAEAEDQNQQSEKRGFAKENRSDSPYLKATLLAPISPYEVKAGTILPGVLITGINSDLPGQMLAQARENVYDTASGRFLLVPMGSRFLGEYDSKISYGQERVLVVWTRIIMPNGNSISLENMPGVDLSGYAGVSGRVNNHYAKLVTGVVLGSVLGAGAQVAVGGQGTANTPPSFGQLFTAGAAGNLNQAGQRITEKNLNLQPTIEVSPGARINIFVTKDMILKPYAD
jgi:type IV secretion system protein TrbI